MTQTHRAVRRRLIQPSSGPITAHISCSQDAVRIDVIAPTAHTGREGALRAYRVAAATHEIAATLALLAAEQCADADGIVIIGHAVVTPPHGDAGWVRLALMDETYREPALEAARAALSRAGFDATED